MTATTNHIAPRRPSLELSPLARAAVGTVGVGLTAASALAIIRYAAGLAPDNSGAHLTAVAIHVAAVVPAVPLGAWLMLSRKGTPRHKLLGRIWVMLMIVTALSALFIRQANHGQFSPIHLFVPLTLYGAWKAVSTIRRGDMAGHRKALIGLYLGALALPGLFSFLPNRLMGTWLLG
ncbi:MAG: DUF2306 domain-containing protein [Novosphingobium sp.]